jgi:hypothetical protein
MDFLEKVAAVLIDFLPRRHESTKKVNHGFHMAQATPRGDLHPTSPSATPGRQIFGRRLRRLRRGEYLMPQGIPYGRYLGILFINSGFENWGIKDHDDVWPISVTNYAEVCATRFLLLTTRGFN